MSPATSAASSIFQSFLDDGVARGVAPGFQCAIFDDKSLVFNGVSGLASAPSENAPDGKPMKPETVLWLASCTKISISLIVLHIIEQGLAKSGFSLKDIDNHEALVDVLPEFKHGSGSPLTKIIEGFEDGLGADGKKIMKLKDANGRVTLRMLLTHTAGMAYEWNHPLLVELYRPSDGSVPRYTMPAGGDIKAFEAPLVAEPNSTYHCATDWLGQFAVRASGKTLRQLFKDIIFEPLNIPPSEADIWLSPSLVKAQADVHVQTPDGGFTPIPFALYATENEPPEGKAYYASACAYSSMQSYAKVLQAVLIKDPRILSKETWTMAIKDDLKDRGIKVSRPEIKSAVPAFTNDVDEFAKSTSEDGAGMNLLQCRVATAPTVSGRPAGSFGWAGLANTYFFVDPVTGIGSIFGTQLLPFYEPRVIEMRDKLEALVYKTLFSV